MGCAAEWGKDEKNREAAVSIPSQQRDGGHASQTKQQSWRRLTEGGRSRAGGGAVMTGGGAGFGMRCGRGRVGREIDRGTGLSSH